MKLVHDDFLLTNPFAVKLFHGFAKDLPVIDYHCHLPPQDIASNRQFKNMTAIWLEDDHYKWRAMRTLGIDERFITGSAPDKEKFGKWAFTVPFTIRNPLYHWTHLELKRYFDIDKLLNPGSAPDIYRACSEKLSTPDFRTHGLLEKMKVEVVCTTDDPVDTLEHHKKLSGTTSTVVLPTFRPDRALAIDDVVAYNAYLEQLGVAAGIEINSFEKLMLALETRLEFFHACGCRLSDHGLEHLYHSPDDGGFGIDRVFVKITRQEKLSREEVIYFKYNVLKELGKMYHRKGWTQQFHLGALRNTNFRMMDTLGANTGFDSIGDFPQASQIAKFLNELDRTNQLTKTILYNLNPADNEVMASMIGNFNDGSVKGKIQFGSAWWFLDQKDGMEKQINALSNLGLISCFIGMITDSRSFLSYPRHEYFRRVLCNLFGQDVQKGELPPDEKWLGKIVADICYHNARQYFGFQKKT